MILIADTGATTSSWRLIGKHGDISQFQTHGFNPYYQETGALEKSIRNSEVARNSAEVVHVFYYGAGCGTEANRFLVKEVLLKVFTEAEVYVYDDMTAACRALCGSEQGIVCILGTGANSCFYDGDEPSYQVASLGFILGDEGSGAYLGKALLADYLRNDLPENLSERIKKRFDLTREKVLDKIYNNELPARYMAGFTKFIFQNIKEPYAYRTVYDAFSLFFDRNVLKYPQVQSVPVHFSGSVGFYFSNILRQVGNDKGVVIRNIIESPVAGLTLYHKNQYSNK
ncbi:MAG: N-acetylglucosamine kinase [Bacteroidota bacterium]